MKKLLAVLLGAVFIFTGCGNKPQSQVSEKQDTKVEEKAAETKNDATATDAKDHKDHAKHCEGKEGKNCECTEECDCGESCGCEDSCGCESSDKASAVNFNELKLKPEEAFDEFAKLHANAKVEKFQLERDNSQMIYKIEGYDDKNEYEVKVDPNTKEVIRDEKDDLGSKDGKEIKREDLAKIQKFIDMSLKDEADTTLKEFQMDFDNGVMVVKVETEKKNGTDIEYKYDASTEKLIKKDK